MRMALVLTAAVAAAAGGCGDDGIVLTADRDAIPADGLALVAVEADVVSGGARARDGEEVSFRASEALLFAAPEHAEPAVAGGLVAGARELDVEVRDGRARVYVRAPVAALAVLVDARFRGDEDQELGASVTVDFTAPPPVAAGRHAGADLAAVEPLFAFDCAASNIGALVTERPNIVVGCALVLRDASGRALPHAPIALFAEAGELLELAPRADQPRGIVYVAPALPVRYPADVAPIGDEQSVAIEGATIVPGAVERNPRDGLVTLLVVARGHEAFDDLDGNGVRDPDEPFVDEGEPFLDVDDDGVHDADIDGPHCCDTNGNGKVDGPNGVWDGDVWLGRVAHILWSGAVSEADGRSAIGVDPAQIPAGERAAMTLTVVDDNYNPVAMHGTGDGFELRPVGPLRLFPPPDIEIERGLGLVVADRYPFFRFGDTPPATGAMVLDGVRTWTATVEDDRDDVCVAADWALEVVVTSTPAPNAGAASATLVAEGTVERAGEGPCP